METDGSTTSPGFSATYVSYDAMDDEGAEDEKKKGWPKITVNSYIPKIGGIPSSANCKQRLRLSISCI